jgi:hypothetical protein
MSKTLRIYATNIFIYMDYVYSFQKYYKQNNFYINMQFYGLKITQLAQNKMLVIKPFDRWNVL